MAGCLPPAQCADAERADLHHLQAKADVTLLRGIPFSGLVLFCSRPGISRPGRMPPTSAPAFPYARLTVGKRPGAAGAIAGFETGFSELLWVAQDFGVYWMSPGSLAPNKVSPPISTA
jgi:hypothetical protein